MAPWVTWSVLCFRLQPFISGQSNKRLAVETVSCPSSLSHLLFVSVARLPALSLLTPVRPRALSPTCADRLLYPPDVFREAFFPFSLLLNLLLNWTWFSRRCESALPVSPSPHGRLSFLLSARLFRLIRTRKSSFDEFRSIIR